MASQTSLVIVTPSASRARVLPSLLKLPAEIKIETITETESWRPQANQPVVVDLASPESVLKKLAGMFGRAGAPPVLLIGEPWLIDKDLAARLGPEMIFAPLPLTEQSPALQAAGMLEDFVPSPAGELKMRPVEIPEPEKKQKPAEPAPEPSPADDSVAEMVERLEMLLGDEDD